MKIDGAYLNTPASGACFRSGAEVATLIAVKIGAGSAGRPGACGLFALALGLSLGCSDEPDPGLLPSGGTGAARAGSGASGSAAGASGAIGTGGAAGASGTGGASAVSGAGGTPGVSGGGGAGGMPAMPGIVRAGAAGGYAFPLPVPIPDGPLPNPGYVGCEDGFSCDCLLGGDHVEPWHVCAPPCDADMPSCAVPSSGSARAECTPSPVNLLGRRFLTGADACVLHCEDDASCPAGLRCVQGGRNTRLCAEPGLRPSTADLSAYAPRTPVAPPVVAAPSTRLCGARVEDGELSFRDPTFRRPALDSEGCLFSETGGWEYDLYTYELVGPGPHQLRVHTCSPLTMFDSVFNIYQDREGTATPFDVDSPCTNLVTVADDSVHCDNDGAMVYLDGLAEGTVMVVMLAFGPGTNERYQLVVESPTSTCQ